MGQHVLVHVELHGLLHVLALAVTHEIGHIVVVVVGSTFDIKVEEHRLVKLWQYVVCRKKKP